MPDGRMGERKALNAGAQTRTDVSKHVPGLLDANPTVRQAAFRRNEKSLSAGTGALAGQQDSGVRLVPRMPGAGLPLQAAPGLHRAREQLELLRRGQCDLRRKYGRRRAG